jgi:hypothetical protein
MHGKSIPMIIATQFLGTLMCSFQGIRAIIFPTMHILQHLSILFIDK